MFPLVRKIDRHLTLSHQLEGPLNTGVANVHLVKLAGHDEFEYRYFYVDVRGHSRIYLENNSSRTSSSNSKKFKLFGVNWN